MKFRTGPAAVLMILAIAPFFTSPGIGAQGSPRGDRTDGPIAVDELPNPLKGGPAVAAKAGRDSFLLLGPTGSGAPYIGDFEYAAKALDPGSVTTHGWTSVDETQPDSSHWHVSDYHAVNGSYSAFCGDESIPSCDGGVTDPVGGYGNGWDEFLEFRGTVDNNAVNTTLTITATANISSEPGYDFVSLHVEKSDGWRRDIEQWDGVSNGLAISETATYVPGDYVGAGADEVVVIWRFESDIGWSDEDCSFTSSGGIQLDDVQITSDNGVSTGVVDFEDGTLGPFVIRMAQGVGDFARVWSNLGDRDPCATNSSYQVAFIDDGQVVPGTGGSPCITWCYGPGGFIVSTTGGLAGPHDHIQNNVYSPVMEWPDPAHRGARFDFDVFRDETLTPSSPGVYYIWSVRSSNTGDPGDIEGADWRDRGFVYMGGPDYIRPLNTVDDLLVPGATHVQVRVGPYELGWVWGWIGNDGTPAPYFDNVRLTTYDIIGPSMSTREIDLAQDAFPASGTLDMTDPGALSVRFDMARDISPANHQFPAAGDSIAFDCVVSDPDAVLDGMPRLVYRVKANPVFDPYRTSVLPTAGEVECQPVFNSAGVVVADRYSGDLDDEGFLFPGDIVHYYIRATERDTLTDALEIALLPADTTGFSDFEDFLNYSPSFTMQCLPTVGDLSGGQPPILFWNDFGDRGGREEWYTSLRNLGLIRGRDFDAYYTNGPSSGVGNGLGAAATPLQLEGYETLLYSSGDLSVNTIANGDINNDSSPDVQTLAAWLDAGDRHAFLTGDNLATNLGWSGTVTSAFREDMMQVSVDAQSVADLIGGQTAPRVLPEAGQTVLTTVGSWIAYGGCQKYNRFDAVRSVELGTRIAVFANPAGGAGGYPYAAATLASGVGQAGTSEVISLPYDFMFVHTDPDEIMPGKANATLAGRVRLLQDVLARFGLSGDPAEVSGNGLPAVNQFGASHHPNPFNPTARISFTVARPGRLEVKIYDLRGRLVRKLFDDQVTSSGFVDWHGDDDRGAQVASGVYFYEVRMGGQVSLGKMALIR